MTTIPEGQQAMLAAYETSPDPEFRGKMREQVLEITGELHCQRVWDNLPPHEKQQCGSINNHPQGMELCLTQWVTTRAKQWGDSYASAQAQSS